MTTDQQIELIYSRHDEWLKIALFWGVNIEDAEDVVQELYISLIKMGRQEGGLGRIFNGHHVNDIYMFRAIQNRCLNVHKSAGRTVGIEHCYDLPCENPEDIRQEKVEQEQLLEEIEGAKRELCWFDRKLLEVYYRDGKSLRQLAKETHISFPTIAYTVKKAKKHIKSKLHTKKE